MLQLKGYQERSLEALETFLALASNEGAKKAFMEITERPYRSVQQLPGLPYVCLRVPTGGGKTFMACHALGTVAKTFLQADRALCLWLVPTNTILDQTLAALRKREHPYRQAVDARFAGQVRVMDLKEALYVQRASLDGETVIIVSTLAALRVENTDGRKIYETAGALSHHFSGLQPDQEALLEKDEHGVIPHSLANVLRMRRPVVIMDEAHNARTELSFETLERFNPSCIVEFTATPETKHDPERKHFASNVLHHVSAAELKHDDMVKLPIRLRTKGDWKQVVADALERRRLLETAALEEEKETGEYLRPIVLLQAQPKSQERQNLTVDAVKKCLMEDFKIPEEEIAIATGDTREIDDVNLFDRKCPLRFIITVAALKEGWDCSFAYVLCSVSEIGTARAVEQILGRIMRLPGAKKKKHPELNCSYASVASERFLAAANSLRDALVENGFEKMEAKDLVQPQDEPMLFPPGGLFNQASVVVAEKPDLPALPEELRERVKFEESTGTLTVTGAISVEEKKAVQECFKGDAGKKAVDEVVAKLQGKRAAAKPMRVMKVPALAVRSEGQFQILDEDFILSTPWTLAECDATLSDQEFPSDFVAGTEADLDVTEGGKVEVKFVEELHQQLARLIEEPGATVPWLVNWLDKGIPHADITQTQSRLFIEKAVAGLVESRGISVEKLAREKYRLRNALEEKIAGHRREAAKKAYNKVLFSEEAEEFQVSTAICFSLSPEEYAPNSWYQGPQRFPKHFYAEVGGMNDEEAECAYFMERLEDVESWVRNVERQPESSFWLPTSTDRFYPDFVAQLKDGRFLVVEYKRVNDWTNDDSKEKRLIGALWAEASKGQCLFVMPKGKDFEAIRAAIAKPNGPV